MKLVFDQNLSDKLCVGLQAEFPGSEHVKRLGLKTADDASVWEFARLNGFAIVSLDVDFANLSSVRGQPPKVIWRRCGNQPTAAVEALLLRNLASIRAFFEDEEADCLEILP